MNEETICTEVHTIVNRLQLFRDPQDVLFKNGLYFFFEESEKSEHGPKGRIVRVGNHPRSKDRLKDRLRDHYSPNKNVSVFRRLLGGALLRRDEADPGSGLAIQHHPFTPPSRQK